MCDMLDCVIKQFCVIFIFASVGRSQLTTDMLWKSCDTTICGERRLNIQCDQSSLILINNVTSGLGRAFDEVSYANLRRTCHGRYFCQTSNPELFCKAHNATFNVSYVCIRESLIDKSCSETTLKRKIGFILSPGYPTETNRRSCKWKIDVPADHQIHIYLHEVLTPRSLSPADCDSGQGGLIFTTQNACGHPFPTYSICNDQHITTTISACSSIEILMLVSDNDHAIRFWLSYHVVAADDLRHVTMFSTNITCNVNVLENFTYHIPHEEVSVVINTTELVPTTVYHSVPFSTDGQTDDAASDYVMIVVLVVGVLVLIVVVVVAMIYIRYRYCRQRFTTGSSFKETGSTMSNSNSQTNCSEIQRRPLPETQQSTVEADNSANLVLQQSYSIVADELPREPETAPSACAPAYSTYAEIQEYSAVGEKPKLPLMTKRSVDNSKRELPAKPRDDTVSSLYFEIDDVDAKDMKTEKDSIEKNKNKINEKESDMPYYSYKKKLSNASNIYAECQEVDKKDGDDSVAKKAEIKEDKTYMDMTHKKKEEPAFLAHSKLSKDKVNQSKRSRAVEKPGTKKLDKVIHAEADVKKKGLGKDASKVPGSNKCSVTSESDSDDDICVVENELYEPFESAKV